VPSAPPPAYGWSPSPAKAVEEHRELGVRRTPTQATLAHDIRKLRYPPHKGEGNGGACFVPLIFLPLVGRVAKLVAQAT